METLYTGVARATGGRQGRVATVDGTLDVPLAMPKTLGGRGGAGLNPELLFASGYAACFGSAIEFVAAHKKITTGQVTVTASVSIGKTEKGLGLSVELHTSIAALSSAQALDLIKAAHEVCPYSNAIRGNVDVKLSLA